MVSDIQLLNNQELDFTVSSEVTRERHGARDRPGTRLHLSDFSPKVCLYFNSLDIALTYCRCSDEVAIGKKMIYASSKDALKKRFTGLNTEFQCTDTAEFQHSELVKDMINKDRV